MIVAQNIRSKLTEAFEPVSLSITDESSQHAGHIGARPEGETHFQVVIVAAAFVEIARRLSTHGLRFWPTNLRGQCLVVGINRLRDQILLLSDFFFSNQSSGGGRENHHTKSNNVVTNNTKSIAVHIV